MNKKYYILIGIPLAVIIVLYLVNILTRQQLTSEIKNPTNTESTKVDDLPLLKNVEDYHESDYAKFFVEYPQFINSGDSLNGEIEAYIKNAIADFNANAEENWKARYDTRGPNENITEKPSGDEKFTFSAEWSVAQLNKDYISFFIKTYQYSGGAHGISEVKTFNYDVKNKKLLNLADLFPNDQNYLTKVSDYTRMQLSEQFTSNPGEPAAGVNSMIIEGTAPIAKNFEAFTFKQGKITFYFQDYQVGPHAMGMPTVEMLYSH